MGTVYIDRKDIHVKADGKSLAVYERGERTGVIPLAPLKTIIITSNITIESSALKMLADLNIDVLFLSGKQMRFCGILRGKVHRNGLLRLRQYEKSLSSFSLEISKEIVSKKVSNQKELLQWLKTEKPEKKIVLDSSIGVLSRNLEKITLAESLDSLRGMEGSSSSAYFSAYVHFFAPSLAFSKRTKRPPRDPVNAVLSFLYTRIHYEILREVEIIGLDPTIGFYHQFEYGRDSLACDLVEVFRTEADRFTYILFRERQLTSRDFAKDEERPGVYLKKQGRRKFFFLYEEWVRELRPLFREEVRKLARRIMDGEDPVSQ